MTSPDSTTTAESADRKPLDNELDVFGLTHPGKVRQVNQDHFMLGSLRKTMQVYLTSLPDVDQLPLESERLAFLAMVADGVGGGTGGEEASRLTVEVVTQYVTHSLQCYYTADASDEQTFIDVLEQAALECHESVVQKSSEDPERRRMATTLTLWIGVWPRGYLLQVGDSRCYLFHDGELTQITRDQTLAEELVDRGVFTRTAAHRSRFANVLSSSIGGPQTAPVVTRVDLGWHNVGLICSDGLTKHVSDEQIRERLSTMKSAKHVCEDLLQDALDGGGSDNITIVVGRAVRQEGQSTTVQ
jgi:protein phosphatase